MLAIGRSLIRFNLKRDSEASVAALKDNLLEWKSAPSRSMDSAYHWTSKRTKCAYHSTSSTVKPSELLTSLAGLFDENSLMKMLATGMLDLLIW